MSTANGTLRCAALWLLATVAAAGLVLLAAPAASSATAPGFAPLLVRGCAYALLGCTAWLWLGTSLVLAAAIRGRADGPGVRLLPAGLRHALLAACGVAVLTAGPVAAEPGRAPLPPADGGTASISGLPLPTRPVGSLSTTAWATEVAAALTPSRGAPTTAETHVVRPGESLWSIAAAALPPDAPDGAVDRYWRAIHAHNRGVVGPDPSLIRPGQRLLLPPTA